jgi:hypothetical protein
MADTSKADVGPAAGAESIRLRIAPYEYLNAIRYRMHCVQRSGHLSKRDSAALLPSRKTEGSQYASPLLKCP